MPRICELCHVRYNYDLLDCKPSSVDPSKGLVNDKLAGAGISNSLHSNGGQYIGCMYNLSFRHVDHTLANGRPYIDLHVVYWTK